MARTAVSVSIDRLHHRPTAEPASPGRATDGTLQPMEIVHDGITLARLAGMAVGMFGDLVKAVVDVERGIMAVDAELHADEEALLLSDGSSQADLWGVNLYPADVGTPGFLEFDSMINVRPRKGNRSRSVDDPAVQTRIAAIVERLVTR
jgi:hypothetical protein